MAIDILEEIRKRRTAQSLDLDDDLDADDIFAEAGIGTVEKPTYRKGPSVGEELLRGSEAAATLATGIPAMILGGLAGGTAPLFGMDPEETLETIQSTLTYPFGLKEPTKIEEKVVSIAMKPFEMIRESADFWGHKVVDMGTERGWHPEITANIGALVAIAVEGGAVLGGPKAAKTANVKWLQPYRAKLRKIRANAKAAAEAAEAEPRGTRPFQQFLDGETPPPLKSQKYIDKLMDLEAEMMKDPRMATLVEQYVENMKAGGPGAPGVTTPVQPKLLGQQGEIAAGAIRLPEFMDRPIKPVSQRLAEMRARRRTTTEDYFGRFVEEPVDPVLEATLEVFEQWERSLGKDPSDFPRRKLSEITASQRIDWLRRRRGTTADDYRVKATESDITLTEQLRQDRLGEIDEMIERISKEDASDPRLDILRRDRERLMREGEARPFRTGETEVKVDITKDGETIKADVGEIDSSTNLRYDGEFVGQHSWTYMEKGRETTFISKTKNRAEVESMLSDKLLEYERTSGKLTTTPQSQADKYGIEYRGSEEAKMWQLPPEIEKQLLKEKRMMPTDEEFRKGWEVVEEEHIFWDPQTGEEFRASSARAVGDELKFHRAEVAARSAVNEVYNIDKFQEYFESWKAGNNQINLGDLKERLVDHLENVPDRIFETSADIIDYQSRGDMLIGEINKEMRKAMPEAPPEVAEAPPVGQLRKRRTREIEASIEEKVDIGDKLSPEARNAYRTYKEFQEYATETSEARNLSEVGSDLATLLDERGSFSLEKMNHVQKAALQRLTADAKRLGKDLSEVLRRAGFDEATIAAIRKMTEDVTQKVEPERGMPPKNVAVVSDVPGDTIWNQRKTNKKLQKLPTYVSEIKQLFEANELKGRRIFEGIENPIRTFEEAGLKELIYYPYRVAEKTARVEWNAVKKQISSLRKSVPSKSGKRIGAYAMGQQKHGVKLMQEMGVDIPALTEAELAAYNQMRAGYESFFERINEMRKLIGQEPMKKVDNYFSFVRAFNILDKSGVFTDMLTATPETINARYIKYGATPFKFDKARKIAGMANIKKMIPVELDAFDIFETYMEPATRHLHISPIVAKVTEYLAKLPAEPNGPQQVYLSEYKPRLANFLERWNKHISGHPTYLLSEAFGESGAKLLAKGATKLNRNFAYSILGANLRSALIQASALRNTVTDIGLTHTLEGIKTIVDPKMRKFAIDSSNVLLQRDFDIVVGDAMRFLQGGKVARTYKSIGSASLKPLQWLDKETAIATWNGGYKMALKRGLKGKDAINFADDVVVRTQASSLPGDLAPIQRSALGRAFTLFQTFVINDWGFLTRDVLGIGKDVPITNKAVFKKVMRYVLATTLINMAYEDVVGIRSPFPTPLREFARSRSEDASAIGTFVNVAKELIEPMPVVGSTRYGKNVFGPAEEYIGEVIGKITDQPLAKPWPELLLRPAGIPGTSQIYKYQRGRARGEGHVASLLGKFEKQRKESTMKGIPGLGSIPSL